MLAASTLLVLASCSAVEAPQLYYFTSESCPACRQVEPTVAELKAQGVPVIDVDANQRREWVQQAQVHALPTFIVVVHGQEVGRLVGVVKFRDLSQLYLKAVQLAAAKQPTIPDNPPAPRTATHEATRGVSAANLIRGQDPRPAGPAERLNRALESLNARNGSGCSRCSGSCQCAQGKTEDLPATTHSEPLMSSLRQTPTNLSVNHEVVVEGPSPACLGGALAATVRLKVADELGQSYGTGTIIDIHNDEALVLTCGHIFRDSEGKGRISCDSFAPGAKHDVEGKLISYDIRRDVGLVSFHPSVPVIPAVVGGTGHRPQPDDNVFTIGCNHGEAPTVMTNRIIAVNRYHGPPNVVVGGRPVDGRSGGGLFSANGILIGVCNAADPEFDEGLYAAIGNVHAELDSVGLGYIYRQQQPETALRESPKSLQSTGPASMRLPANGQSDVRQNQGLRAASPQLEAAAPEESNQEEIPPARLGANSEPRNTAQLIATIRPPGNPQSCVELIIERPSRALLDQLSREANSRGPHHQTQLQVKRDGRANDGGWRSLAPR